jgi:3-oxoacyl-(acyl-carrier-protein) synthase
LNALEFYATLRATNEAPLDAVDSYLKGNLADAIGRRLSVTGPCVTVANACSSSADAIGVALSWLRLGLCDIAIAGGADELNRIPLTGFHSLSVMSPEPCRPFDRDRQGLNLGEGAGVIVLETDASAAARGFRSSLRLSGYGAAGDAYHMTAPRPDGAGLESAIRAAMMDAGIATADVAFVSAHGTATRDNDKTEATTLARVFGPSLRFLSTKGFTGHALGAAGGMAAVFTALGLREGWLPANAGFQTLDPEIGIAPLSAVTPIAGAHGLATALAFGGSNAALVISRADARVAPGRPPA